MTAFDSLSDTAPEAPDTQGDAKASPKSDQPAIWADETAARHIDLSLGNDIRGLIHDPVSGLASRPAEEVLAAVPDANAELDKIGAAYLAQPANARQRGIVEPLAAFRIGLARGQIENIADRASARLDDITAERRIDGSKQDAALSWDNGKLLRVLGRGAVQERRYQGERKGWSKDETDSKLRQDLSDVFAVAIEGAMAHDLDRANKLYAHALDVILPDRQVILERKLAEAREDRHVTDIAGALKAIPLDPSAPPASEAYRARAEELTPDDAPPELRGRIARLAEGAQRRAGLQWQHDRNQAGLAAVDWIVANPGLPVAALDRKIAAQLTPEQQLRLQEIESSGRMDTDPETYEQLDRQAVYDPKGFAGADVERYRLALHGEDYRRFLGFQSAMREGRADPALARYAHGRTLLDRGLREAGVDSDSIEARNARVELDKTLRLFDAIEGRSPMFADIGGVAAGITQRSHYNPDIIRVSGGNIPIAQDNSKISTARDVRRSATVEPQPGTPEYRDTVGYVVRLPDGSSVPDKNSATGMVMSPVPDLSEVAAQGREMARQYRLLRSSPDNSEGALTQYLATAGIHLGHGGLFDYQRGPGNSINGFEQRRQFRNISNINVGLFGQQAGLTLEQVLGSAGEFAFFKSSNANSKEPYGLHPQTKEYIERGYKIGESGMYGPAETP